jgi:Phage T7 capsid assembly protein
MSEQQLQTTPAVAEVDPGHGLAGPTASTPAATDDDKPSRPAGVPEKFWNPDCGAVRTEALLKSYLELERKLGSMVPLPADETDQDGQTRLLRALGVPEAPEQYRIEPRHDLIEPDPEINARLHEAGFTERQAQLVYDLAADHLVPLLDDALGELQATREVERLAARLGGEAAWRTMAPQIKAWGQTNLAPDVFQTLASSYDGVLAIHQMMQGREPAVLNEANGPGPGLDEVALARMMRDPRYWRERDPAFVGQVTAGFERLYPSST